MPPFLTNEKKHLEPLESEIGIYQQTNSSVTNKLDSIELQAIKSVGASILTLWNKDDIGDAGWKTGKKNYS